MIWFGGLSFLRIFNLFVDSIALSGLFSPSMGKSSILSCSKGFISKLFKLVGIDNSFSIFISLIFSIIKNFSFSIFLVGNIFILSKDVIWFGCLLILGISKLYVCCIKLFIGISFAFSFLFPKSKNLSFCSISFSGFVIPSKLKSSILSCTKGSLITSITLFSFICPLGPFKDIISKFSLFWISLLGFWTLGKIFKVVSGIILISSNFCIEFSIFFGIFLTLNLNWVSLSSAIGSLPSTIFSSFFNPST